MRKFTLIFLSFLMLGCAKKELKIPTLAEKGIQELQNHSQVWLFFEVKNNDTLANVNRKNTISTTHWIYNIDKRLPLKAIVPSIIMLQDKHANSMHSEKGMHDYFSYSDTISKRLSFLKFDGVFFKTIGKLPKNFAEENEINYQNYQNIKLVFNKKNVRMNAIETEKSNFKSELQALLSVSVDGKQSMIHLYFDGNLLYQDYLFYRTFIHNLENENILTNKNEFIFN